MLQDDEVRSGPTTWKQSIIYLTSYSWWLIALLFGLNTVIKTTPQRAAWQLN